MSNERLSQPTQRKPYEDFGLIEQEHLFWRVTDKRFKEILSDEDTIIHSAHESSNNYGDFLFVTVSRPGDQQRICMAFYGLGYHEQRERWITQEWFWYQADPIVRLERVKTEIRTIHRNGIVLNH